MWVLFEYFFKIGDLYLLGMWLGMDQRTNIIHKHVLKRLDYVFSISLRVQLSIANMIGEVVYSVKESTNMHF